MNWKEFKDSFESPAVAWGAGHSGRGFYIAEEDYPEEGSVHLSPKEVAALMEDAHRSIGTVCPLCLDDGFDKVGLQLHYHNGCCPEMLTREVGNG